MAIRIRINDRDLNRISARFAELPAQITEGAQNAVDESGEAIREEVERDVRVNTGRLKNRIRVRKIGALGLTADVGWFDRDTYYAQFLEFGTEKIDADPVLTRASEEERGRFPERLQRNIGEAM